VNGSIKRTVNALNDMCPFLATRAFITGEKQPWFLLREDEGLGWKGLKFEIVDLEVFQPRQLLERLEFVLVMVIRQLAMVGQIDGCVFRGW